MTSTATDVALALRDVRKKFGKRHALTGCTADVATGSITALIGANGAGKTTLMSMVAGLLRPDSGTISVLGQAPRYDHILDGVSYLAQHKPLYPSLSVAEMLDFGADTNPDWDADYAREIATSTGIGLRARVKHLSPGQRTIVAVALVLGRRPDLLMLDEPMADLDPLARRTVAQILMADVAERGTTLLLSSHVLSEVADLADAMILLGNGQVRLEGPIDEVLSQHFVLTGAGTRSEAQNFGVIVEERGTRGMHSYLICGHAPSSSERWNVGAATLDDVVIGYLRAEEVAP
ncbi:ABC transporter ATP-binding protein [Hoyosella sp. YIM 151337]|uniref:ABC transporter ATP-binding protein n=1 Tax=Hoyosella sp. YIM 151337 TaxID=2992742 RepID=UPI0022356F83|nr:ABC transporter ATP-binding protein [Hoyosella sp. YIM 151337]MCW4353815.1 ABC transporter ATP-binding protein [Hoyosella sp. YIM 151337]